MTPKQIEDMAKELCDSGNPEDGWALRGAIDRHRGDEADATLLDDDHEYHDDYWIGYLNPDGVFAHHNITPDED